MLMYIINVQYIYTYYHNMMYVNVCIMCFSHRLAFTVFACQGKGKAKARASESRKWDLKNKIINCL